MRRHLTQPRNPRILHRSLGVEAFGHGMADHRLPFFLEQFDQPLLLLYQRVNLRGFMVEEVCDCFLFKEIRKSKFFSQVRCGIQVLDSSILFY